MTFILNHLNPCLSIFRKCLHFLEPNAGVLTVLFLQSADYQRYSFLKYFANDEAYRLIKRLLRKSRPILLDFIGAKLLIFRKSRKFFGVFLHLRRNNSILICCIFVKTFKMKHLRKTHFSQMILPFRFVSISQRTMNDQLNYSDISSPRLLVRKSL